MEVKKIYTRKMAVYLREQGFKIIGTEVNKNKPEFDVYLFKDSNNLREAMIEYSKNFCSC